MTVPSSSSAHSIGVIIPFYDGGDTILSTLNSVINIEAVGNIKVVVVNDGSSRNHYQRIANLTSSLNNTYLVNKDNGGVASARNAGFRKAKELGCERVVFLDQDDLMTKEGLVSLITEMSQEPDVVAIYGSVIAIDSEGNRISDQRHRFKRYSITRKGLVFSSENTGPLNTDYLLLDCCIVSPGQALIRTDALSQLDGPFNESLHGVDDWDLWLRLSLKGKITGIEKTTLNYRIHDSNVSKNIAKMRKEGLKMRLSWLKILPLHSSLKMAVFYVIRAYSRRSGK